MLRPLFVYGTLMDGVFLSRLLFEAGLERELLLEPARLNGWRRGRVRGASYPGIEIFEDASTEGMLLFVSGAGVSTGVDRAFLAILDDYEGELYERLDVSALTSRGIVPSQVYALKAEHQHILEDEDWSPA